MSDPSVDQLRQQLRDRGYLSHGIERWFALDPWSSRAFWLELATVALKGGTLLALFAALPPVAIMLFRNHPLTALETLLMTLLYGAAAFTVAFCFLMVIALILRVRPQIAIDTPRALLAISFTAAAVLTFPIVVWWYRFDAAPQWAELVTGLASIVVFYLMATVIVSAALLSFSIYELQRVPAIHRKSRGVPMTTAAMVLIALLFLPAYARDERQAAGPPILVVTRPTRTRIALIAVDGLTHELFHARPDLGHDFAAVDAMPLLAGESTAERWASIGTGVPTRVHGVHAIEGVRFRGGSHLVQTLSRTDPVLRDLAPAAGLARREPLPPTVRRRDYVWELFAARGLPSAAVNWWTSDDARQGALDTIGQASVFAAAGATGSSPDAAALRVDETARRRFFSELDRDHPQFATLYLPALDVLLNRLGLDQSTQVAASVRALDGVRDAIDAARQRGYEVFVIGLPGDRQKGSSVFASTIPLTRPATSPYDVAPTIAALLGFPASAEMPGSALAGDELPRVPSYGPRAGGGHGGKVDQEYYQNLKSLGYIR